MSHRIREAMRSDMDGLFGTGGGVGEVDETYIGQKRDVPAVRGVRHKMRVVSLVDRASGQARSIHSDKISGGEVAAIVRANVAREARLFTDEHRMYWSVGREFAPMTA